MPIGMYRVKRSGTKRGPDKRDRGSSYVESKSAMEKALTEALERNKERLNVQREEIRRRVAVRRGLAGTVVVAGKNTVLPRGL